MNRWEGGKDITEQVHHVSAYVVAVSIGGRLRIQCVIPEEYYLLLEGGALAVPHLSL